MAKPKLELIPKRSYFQRDPQRVCFACGQSWQKHTDEEWLAGCQQRKAMEA
jgi:hypothetical protein